jgi:hypothetical protein
LIQFQRDVLIHRIARRKWCGVAQTAAAFEVSRDTNRSGGLLLSCRRMYRSPIHCLTLSHGAETGYDDNFRSRTNIHFGCWHTKCLTSDSGPSIGTPLPSTGCPMLLARGASNGFGIVVALPLTTVSSQLRLAHSRPAFFAPPDKNRLTPLLETVRKVSRMNCKMSTSLPPYMWQRCHNS